MTTFLIYLLEVMACSGILYLWYVLFLRNKVFHQWNRFYLLAAVLLSLFLPLLHFTIELQAGQVDQALDLLAAFASAQQAAQVDKVPNDFVGAWQRLLLGVYITGCLLSLLGLLRSLVFLYRLCAKNKTLTIEGVNIVYITAPGAPFSFFYFIFWNPEICLQSTAGQQIFQHEMTNVKEGHSWDKVMLQIIQVLCWYNPFFWLMKKEVHCVHEFLADQKAAGEGDATAFANILLQAAYPAHYQQLVNSFFQTSIKRRMIMLTKKQRSGTMYLGRLAALPLLALTAMAFTVQVENKRPTEQTTNTAAAIFGPKVFSDTLPRKEKEIKRVDVDKKAETVTITYADGTKKQMTEKDLKAKGELPAEGKKQNISITKAGDKPDKPLLMVDGEEYKQNADSIDPNTIESVNVLKGDAAIALYGEKGRKGVIEIKLKKAKPVLN